MQSNKLPYQTPQLTIYGSISNLTNTVNSGKPNQDSTSMSSNQKSA